MHFVASLLKKIKIKSFQLLLFISTTTNLSRQITRIGRSLLFGPQVGVPPLIKRNPKKKNWIRRHPSHSCTTARWSWKSNVRSEPSNPYLSNCRASNAANQRRPTYPDKQPVQPRIMDFIHDLTSSWMISPTQEPFLQQRASSLSNGCYTSKTHAYIQLARDTLIMDDIQPQHEEEAFSQMINLGPKLFSFL